MSMDEQSVKERIKRFIADFAKLEGPGSVPEAENLFDLGYLNSLGFVSMLVFLNEELGVSLEGGIESYDDMTTVASIYEYFFASRGSST